MSEVEKLEQKLETLRALPTPRRANRGAAIDELVSELAGMLMLESREMQDAIRPTVHVAPAEIHVEPLPAPEVRVTVPDQSDAIAALTAVLGRIAAAIEGCQMVVNVPEQPAPVVNVQVPDDDSGRKRVSVERNAQGFITGMTVDEEE